MLIELHTSVSASAFKRTSFPHPYGGVGPFSTRDGGGNAIANPPHHRIPITIFSFRVSRRRGYTVGTAPHPHIDGGCEICNSRSFVRAIGK